MAGRPKKRIDYSGWSVDIFSNDIKIDKLLDAHGWIGFGIYFYLCQMAFGGEGYFYEWCYDLCATTARKMGGGVGAGTVKETVDYCLQIGLFNKRLFDEWGVLTSRGIQKSFFVVLKSKNRRGTEIYSEYWLLDKNEEDYQGIVFVSKNKEKLTEDNDSLGENDYKLGVNDDSLRQKDSKVKYKKKYSKEYKEKEHFVPPTLEDVIEYCKAAGLKTDVRRFFDYYESVGWKVGKTQKMMQDWKAALRNWEREDEKKFRETIPLTRFHNFQQHSYDFEELEKKLFIN